MSLMPITVERKQKRSTPASTKYLVEFDRKKLERLAAVCGWFHPEFIASIERAEADIKAGRVEPLASFQGLCV